jgi:hypothetical protein
MRVRELGADPDRNTCSCIAVVVLAALKGMLLKPHPLMFIGYAAKRQVENIGDIRNLLKVGAVPKNIRDIPK